MIIEDGRIGRVFSLIDTFPGLYFREMQSKTNLSVGALDYYLHRLQKRDFVYSRRIWRNVRYFSHKVSKEESLLIGLLRNEAVRTIIKNLIASPLTHAQTRKLLELSPSTTTWYLQKLRNDGIIAKKKNSDPYCLVDKIKVNRVYSSYEATFGNKIISNFISMWEI